MTPEAHYTRRGTRFTRKEMLKLGVLGGAALLLPLERRARTQLAVAGRIPESRLPEPFQVPFPTTPALKPVRRSATTDYYQITMKANKVPILPGFPATEIWGYNGITPGPTIKVMKGRKAVVRQINRLPRRHPTLGYESWTSVHLHGSASLPQYDGYANDITYPGRVQGLPLPQHPERPHPLVPRPRRPPHRRERLHGLAGQYHLHDKHERALPIPKGRLRRAADPARTPSSAPTARSIFDDGSSRGGHDSLFGDVILANGAPWPVMKVERRKYRFRVLNASISRGYNLALSSGEPMTIIGHDGGLAPAPVEVDHFRIGMAERYEVVIDFAKYKIGDKVDPQEPRAREQPGLRLDPPDHALRRGERGDGHDQQRASPRSSTPAPTPDNPMKLQESQAVRRAIASSSSGNGGEWTSTARPGTRTRGRRRASADEMDVWEFENKSRRLVPPAAHPPRRLQDPRPQRPGRRSRGSAAPRTSPTSARTRRCGC